MNKTRTCTLNIQNNEKKLRIAISCIGSGVGQSVINSLKHANFPFFTLGLGTNPYAFGAYECDKYDYTKSIYDEGFLSMN